MPARSDLWPAELARPFFSARGEFRSLLSVGEQVHGRIDPHALALRVLDTSMEALRLVRWIRRFARDLDPELDAGRQCADVRGDRHAAAGLGLLDRDAVGFQVSGGIGENRPALV